MLGLSKNPRSRARKSAQRLAERGLHRAEAFRDSLPDRDDVMHDLRDQAQPMLERAQPVLDRAMDRARDMAVDRGLMKKRSRSKKPWLLVGLLAVLGAVVAYIYLSRRDEEPALLMQRPDEPDTSPADAPTGGPSNYAQDRGTTMNGADSPSPSPATSGTREMAGAWGGHHPTPPPSPQASTSSSPFASASSSWGQPSGGRAAWDLPRS